MRITSKSKIAFHILLDIAAHTAAGRAISIPLMCHRHSLSHSYLEAIFTQLREAGLIKSHRGPGGGYSLSREPKDISLYEVVRLMNGAEDIREDLGASLWADLDRHMSVQMQQINLSEALQRSSITLEESTKGLILASLNKSAKVSVESKISTASKSKKGLKKAKPRLGPNSVFAFGKYLKSCS